MRLPDNSIGITDLLTYRECQRKFSHGMRRHSEGGDAPGDKPVHPAWHYGTIVHDGISWIEEDMLTNDEAVERCFDVHARWIEPEDADRLRADFETYRSRDESGVILVANEKEIKVPLMRWDYENGVEVTDGSSGETIYFRGRIDRLYQNAQNPSIFIHRDYKSSRWRTSEEEVHEDKQLWAYNAAIFRVWPECQDLTQWYDQLRYGDIPTKKSGEQRAQMWEWLKREVASVLRAPDENPEPTHNEWCPWCPIMESCSEVPRLAGWAIARIEELAGESGKIDPELLKDGSFDDYVEDLPLIERARKMAERYEESVRGELKKLPDTRLDELGYKKSERSSTSWTPEAMRATIDRVGIDKFLLLVGMTKSRVEKMLNDDDKEAVMGMATKGKGSLTVTRKREDAT